MGWRRRNNELTMTTFHSRQTSFGRRVRKQANASTFKFTSHITPSICSIMLTKRDKSSATIFTSRCSRTVMRYRFYRVQALPLSWLRFWRLANSSPKIARSPAGRSRDVRATSGKISGEMSCAFPCNFPAMTGQRQMQSSRITCGTTRKTTCVTAGVGRAMAAPDACETTSNLASQQPCRRLRDGQGNISPPTYEFPSSTFKHDNQKL